MFSITKNGKPLDKSLYEINVEKDVLVSEKI